MNALAFHIDPNDMSLRRCGRPDDYAWGTLNEHYASVDAGSAAIEEMMRPPAWVRFHKRSAGRRHIMEVIKPVR